jgi:hypothetical protein
MFPCVGLIAAAVIDEYIDPDIMSYQAYGPKRVHQLAIRDLQQGGGATRASTNADSYAWLASCKCPYLLRNSA